MWVIGDIHGCDEQFANLLSKIRARDNECGRVETICLVGDLVDRGPNSSAVVSRAMKEQKNQLQVVAGNHDINFARACVRWQKNGRVEQTLDELTADKAPELSTWWNHGAKETLKSFVEDGVVVIESDVIEFLLQLPLVFRQHTTWVSHGIANMYAIEAAWSNRVTIGDVLDGKANHLRDVYFGRDVATNPIVTEGVHVSGHTTVKEPVFYRNNTVLQLDTACVYGGKLTAWHSGSGEFLSVA